MIACGGGGHCGFYLDCDCPDCREVAKAMTDHNSAVLPGWKIIEAFANCACEFCVEFKELHEKAAMTVKAMTVEEILKAAGLT